MARRKSHIYGPTCMYSLRIGLDFQWNIKYNSPYSTVPIVENNTQ